MLRRTGNSVIPDSQHRQGRSRARSILRWVSLIILSPIRLFLAIRRSMTSASVTLLLVGIVTINIIWGYPWTGMFAACVSMFFVGWLLNWFSRPVLSVDYSLPRSVPAGDPVAVQIHLVNRGRLPASELDVEFESPLVGSRQARGRRVKTLSLNPPQAVGFIQPGEHVQLDAGLRFEERGIRSLPDLSVTTHFPFHLFQSTRHIQSDTTIAVTPRLLNNESDLVAKGLLNSVGNWSRKLLSGDSLDYTGSREYQTGMPVRQWDFVSWARLAKPIVREFQSPSVQSATLIVDTSQAASDASGDLLETTLSLAATATTELCRKNIQLRMYVSSEENAATFAESFADQESLLIRLASAEHVEAAIGIRRLSDYIEQVGTSPVLLLTTRDAMSLPERLPTNVTVIQVTHEATRSSAAKSEQETDIDSPRMWTNSSAASSEVALQGD